MAFATCENRRLAGSKLLDYGCAMPDMHPAPFGLMYLWKATLWCGLALLATVAGNCLAADPANMVLTNLQELQRVVMTQQRFECGLNLEAMVLAADPAAGVLALQDGSGVEVCELELAGRHFFPGERIRISVVNCTLIRHPGSVAITPTPVVDIGGIHPVQEKSGGVYLTAGRQPIRLFYFNAKNPAELTVRYAGPEISSRPVPASALFLDPADAAGATNQLPGLKYFCYDDTPATLDDVTHQQPTSSGVVTNFDISRRVPEEYVAMQFRGQITVPRTGQYEFTVRSDDGSELYVGGFHPSIVVLATNPPPATPPLFHPVTAAPDACEWTTIAGRVIFVGRQPDGLQLDLQEGNHAIRLWLPDAGGVSPSLLPNAWVRATGLLRPVIGLTGQNLFGIMSVVGPENFHVAEIAAEEWDKYPLTQITNVSGEWTGNFITHLRGRVTERQADGEFVLADESGKISVQPAGPDQLTNGSVIEVLGNLERDARRTFIDPAYCRFTGSSQGALPTLTTAAQIQQLSVSEAARQYPVRVRGVVTSLVEWLGATVQDDTRGVFFSFDASYHEGLEVGDFVEINGVTAAGDFAPIIAAKSLRVLGRGELPEPARPNWNQLISGSLDSQYAEVRGIITAVSSNTVTLLTDGGKINVQMHNTGENTLRRLQNTLVRIRGLLLAEWDPLTRQVRVGEIKIHNPVIEVEQLPAVEPFSAPGKTIADLLRFDLHASGFQRVKVSGQVVHVGSGEIFLMQAGKGLRFRPVAATDLQPGDLVDVVGIPDVSGPSPLLHEAVVRKTGSSPLPAPRLWPDTNNPTAVPDADRIQTEARLIGLHHTGPDWVLELQTGLRTYRALVNTTENLANDLPLDSRLRLVGVYATPGQDQKSNLAAFELLLNSPRDIQLLERPPWWNLRRLLVMVATLIVGLAAAALWITQLRRKVEQRTVLLEREHARREHAERERALEFERSRIARDLHDDLGSSLTEIRVMASTGLRTQPADDRFSTLFKSISQKTHSLVSALDVIVWAVDPEANSLQSLADYLSSYAKDYLASAGISSRFRIPVALPAVTLDGRSRHELFLAVKETLHNIVQHSRATEIEFHLRTERQMLEIDIVDNGCGFDLNATSDAGHGLKNIPKRLARLGGSGELISQPGQGTTVRIRLLLPRTQETT